MDVEQRIREIRAEISAITSKKARAVVELDNAQSRLASARDTLKQEFGVSTTEEARAMITVLRKELDSAIAKIEKELSEAGA